MKPLFWVKISLTSRRRLSKKKRSIKDHVVLTTVGRPLRKKETIVRRRHNRHLHMITSCKTLVMICKFRLRRRRPLSKKQDIVKRSCGPYDERRSSRYATFAYDRGAALPKNTTSPWDPYDGWPTNRQTRKRRKEQCFHGSLCIMRR